MTDVHLFKPDELSKPVSKFIQPAWTSLRGRFTVHEAIEDLRGRKVDARAMYFYVVDDEDRLLGVISPRKLILSDGQAVLSDLMDRQVISMTEDTTLEEAMELFALYRLLAIPVTDGQGRLTGQVDVTLYAEEAMDLGEARRVADLFQLIGLSLQQVRQGRAWPAYRMRMPWLLCNIAGGVACAGIAAAFQAVLAQVIMIAMFIPLVLTLSESISMQSMTIGLHYLRAGTPNWKRLWGRATHEWRTALLLGATSAILVAVAATFWGQGGRPVLAIASAIMASMVISASLGTAIPALLHLLRLDPRVAAGPVVLMIADVTTMIVYLGLATLWLI